MSMPCSSSRSLIVGKRRRRKSAPRCRASSHTWSDPVSAIRRTIACATTSRGASSAIGCTSGMNRTPSVSSSSAPSPRTASDTSVSWPFTPEPSQSTVGWNCTNSTSPSTAPARSAAAIPSPVACAGLVDERNTWPMPPVASTTARPSAAPTPSRCPSPITCSVTPHARPGRPSASGRAGEHVEDERVLDDLDARVVADRLDLRDERAGDLRARGVAARVRDPVGVVAALAGQRDGAVGRACRTPHRGRRARARAPDPR